MSRKPLDSKKPPSAKTQISHSQTGHSQTGRNGGDGLWQHVTQSVTPLKGKDRRRRDEAAPPAGKAAASRPATARTPAPPPAKPAGKTPAKAAPAGAGFDRATATKFARGQLPVDARLDLHGMTQAAAHQALARFVAKARRHDWRTLLIITGKGRLSEGGGVLRRLLPLWLQEDPFSAQVLALSPAQPKDGGTGAFYLRLRRQRD